MGKRWPEGKLKEKSVNGLNLIFLWIRRNIHFLYLRKWDFQRFSWQVFQELGVKKVFFYDFKRCLRIVRNHEWTGSMFYDKWGERHR